MTIKWLEKWFEKIEPKGKWSWLGSTYEAFHTFAFTPKTVTKSGSHIRDAVDMKRSIITVGEIQNVPRTQNNPHGLLIVNWRTLENKDLDY